jgi:hypothetical protein
VLEQRFGLEQDRDRAPFRRQRSRSSPSRARLPDLGTRKPAIKSSSVDLPDPLGPLTAVTSPGDARSENT